MYTRGGRPLKQGIKGNVLIVEEMSTEGMIGKVFTKTGTVPKAFFQIRNNVKIAISKEEYEQIAEAQRLARVSK